MAGKPSQVEGQTKGVINKSAVDEEAEKWMRLNRLLDADWAQDNHALTVGTKSRVAGYTKATCSCWAWVPTMQTPREMY